MDSDDEYGRAACDYRRGGSDDEEYDYDSDVSSNEDQIEKYPWQSSKLQARLLVDSDDDNVDHNTPGQRIGGLDAYQ